MRFLRATTAPRACPCPTLEGDKYEIFQNEPPFAVPLRRPQDAWPQAPQPGIFNAGFLAGANDAAHENFQNEPPLPQGEGGRGTRPGGVARAGGHLPSEAPGFNPVDDALADMAP